MSSSTNANPLSEREEYPPRANLRKMSVQQPLPVVNLGIIDMASMSGEELTKQALAVLDTFNSALAANDVGMLTSCFFSDQAYWKDHLALTYHLRTFTTPSVISASFLETKTLRGIDGGLKLEGAGRVVRATPALQFIDRNLVFRTIHPAATCSGRMLLLPVRSGLGNNDETIHWKIWVLNTKLENLDVHPENEALLKTPGRRLDGLKTFETDVLILGGGNAAVALAARLKALGVESVMVERNGRVGDNWALRYDSMRFHFPTALCELPYMRYDEELQAPHLLSRNELVEHLQRYVAAFDLNIINSAKIQTTLYDTVAKRWIVKFQTPIGECTATSKHLVQATGIGSQKPYLPPMADTQLYKGIVQHSVEYKNPSQLSAQGAKSAIVIGSANTAFDVVEDCHAAGLKVTMIVRSPTYVVPTEELFDDGTYHSQSGTDAADRFTQTLPTIVEGHFVQENLRHLASQKPDRYAALSAAGFPVLDSRHPDALLMHNIVERSGGHYVDVGNTKLLAEGKVDVKAGVEPVAYTATGLRFSDGSTVDADAVLWCTGFADKDARRTAADILGGRTTSDVNGSIGDKEACNATNLLGPREIAARLDATWGVDVEGEVRGMWKRHLHLDNYWIVGGSTSYHRWHSRTVALQIKAALEGVLPPAYRGSRKASEGETGGIKAKY